MKCANDTLELALEASGCEHAKVVHKPRLLNDNGSSYISGDLAKWLKTEGMEHTRRIENALFARCALNHPQSQGKIERWHQTMKNRILLDNYYLPGDLEQQIGQFIEYYNHHRYHEAINNVTPADVNFGRDQAIIRERKNIKLKTIQTRRLQHQKKGA